MITTLMEIMRKNTATRNRPFGPKFRRVASLTLGLCLAAFCLTSVTVKAQSPEWQPQSSGTAQVLLGVSFTDGSRGYAVGTNGVIRTTTNGGSTWSPQASGTSRFLRDVYFSDATHGVIVGESGLILRTTDGATWTPQSSGTTEHLVHVNFINNEVGMACGQGGVILKTTNGGVSWTPQSSGTGVELPGVDMLDVNTAVAVGFGGTILRTTNGGGSWNSVSVPGFGADLRSVHFWGNTGVAVSMGGGILKSTDAGQSWTQVTSGTGANLFAVQFRDANTVYAAGTAVVRVSNDGGTSWAAATTTPFGGDLYGLSFGGNRGWAVGQNGLILRAEGPSLPPATVQFSAATYSANENVGSLGVTVTRSGDTSGTSTVSYASSDGAGASGCGAANGGVASSRCDYSATAGTLSFAAGETSKTLLIPIINDVYAEGSESFSLTLSSPSGATLGSQSTATVSVADDDVVTGVNPVGAAPFFVRVNYVDFLNREPDADGFNFWVSEIENCTPQPQCVEVKRINVSAAFFLAIEFQQTGYLIERLYKVAYGDATGTSTLGGTPHQLAVPIVRINEFLPDTQQISRGVVVNQPGWEQVLENNKQAFAAEFAQRPRFTSAYPASMTAAQFVDRLNANAGNPLSTAERSQLVADLTNGVKTRAQVLRAVAEDDDLFSAEKNRAFVLMQYFGYMRRNPNDPQDSDYTGYDFWLGKLNDFNGNFVSAEMVKAFILSAEYNQRFGP